MGFRITVSLTCIFLIFVILHLAHVSSFYTIKTYMEAMDVPKIRNNFVS